MRNFLLSCFPLLLLFSCQSNHTSDQRTPNDQDRAASLQLPEPDADNGGLLLPEGFSALVVADKLGNARHITIRENGDIFIALGSLKDGNGIVALRDTSGDGRAYITEYFGSEAGTGIGIYNGYLYFGSDNRILRYRFHDDELLPDTRPEVVISGFPSQTQHAAKPFAFDNKGNIYVNVGAPSNNCMHQTRAKGSPGKDPCPELELQAGIWRFDAGPTKQTQREHGYRYGSGIRNSIAIAWNHDDDHLYVVQHGRDQLHAFWPEIYTEEQNAELPAEEFLKLTEGIDFGYPYCFYDHIQGKRVLAPEYGGDGQRNDRCENYPDPILAFPAHWAPNGLLFYDGNHFPSYYRNGAFVAFHGSWDRAPFEQQGYFVAYIPFSGGKPEGKWDRFADGFTQSESILGPGDAEYRPMGLAQGPDGSLYITDSRNGRVWRVVYNS